MHLRLLLLVLLLPVFLFGCASLQHNEAAVVPEQATHLIAQDPVQITQCRWTERDLTIDWNSKWYLCSHKKRLAALQRHNSSNLVAHRRKAKPLLAEQTTPDMAVVSSALVVSSTPSHEMVQYHVNIPVEQSATSTNKPINKQLYKIWFSRNSEVLGQKGIIKSLDLIPAIRVSRQVTLRGVYETSEVMNGDSTPINRERFSVGRALSLKNLWTREGVNSDKIKILHHQDKLSGRYVEVALYD